MKKNYEIEFAKMNDIEKWLALVEVVSDDFPGLVMSDYKKVLLENIDHKTALCAKIDDEIVGVLLFSLEDSTLSFMSTHPSFRGLGIASKLIQEMINVFPKDSKILVTTYRDGDNKGQAARALYKRIGFNEAELVEEFGYPCQKFVFET